jgi:hypothetical protein
MHQLLCLIDWHRDFNIAHADKMKLPLDVRVYGRAAVSSAAVQTASLSSFVLLRLTLNRFDPKLRQGQKICLTQTDVLIHHAMWRAHQQASNSDSPAP